MCRDREELVMMSSAAVTSDLQGWCHVTYCYFNGIFENPHPFCHVRTIVGLEVVVPPGYIHV